MSATKRPGPARKSSPSLAREWRDWYETKKPVFNFGLKFGLLIVLLYTLLAMPFFDRWLYAYLKANAWCANGILRAFGQQSQLSDVTITSPRFAMAIRRGCDAVEPTWLFCAAVVAFPAPWGKRLLGMAAGIVLLQLLNLVRIVTLYWVGVHLPAFFNSAHVEVWPVIFILVAILLFVAWRSWPGRWQTRHA